MTTLRGVAAVALLPLLLLPLAACQTPQQEAREHATREWNLARARVKVELAADQLKAGNVPGASAELNAAENLDPENPALLPLRARVWLAEGRISSAIERLERARAAGNATAETEYLLGVAYQQQQRWSDALEAYVRAARLAPGETAYVVAAAQTWLQLGEPQEARQWLQSAGNECRWTDAYCAALAECEEQCGDWPAAAAAWQRAVGSDAAADLRGRLAIALYRAEQWTPAIPHLARLIDEQPEQATPRRLMLAECLLATDEPEAAQKQAETILQRSPENASASRLLARALTAGGQTQRALRVVRESLAAHPTDARSLELAAALAWHAGETRLAHEFATRLAQAEPTNPVAARVLAAKR